MMHGFVSMQCISPDAANKLRQEKYLEVNVDSGFVGNQVAVLHEALKSMPSSGVPFGALGTDKDESGIIRKFGPFAGDGWTYFNFLGFSDGEAYDWLNTYPQFRTACYAAHKLNEMACRLTQAIGQAHDTFARRGEDFNVSEKERLQYVVLTARAVTRVSRGIPKEEYWPTNAHTNAAFLTFCWKSTEGLIALGQHGAIEPDACDFGRVSIFTGRQFAPLADGQPIVHKVQPSNEVREAVTTYIYVDRQQAE